MAIHATWMMMKSPSKMEDPQITINDISIIKEMYTAQINNNETI